MRCLRLGLQDLAAPSPAFAAFDKAPPPAPPSPRGRKEVSAGRQQCLGEELSRGWGLGGFPKVVDA